MFWLNHWWVKVPEPRLINIIVGAAYLAFTLGGAATLFLPPKSIVSAGGDLIMALVGVLMLTGGIVAIIAGTAEFWQLERVGIAAIGLGVLTYAYIVAALHFTEQGSRLTQLSMITVALIFLILRLAMIWRYDFKPRG